MSTLQENTAYPLPRGATETERLNAQHYCWLAALGFHVHPEISKALPENARIADVATGTGVWLTELAAKSAKTQQFEGLDISSLQYPRSHAENISFDLVDILKPVKEEFKARYDLIHIRLIMAGMLDTDWEIAAGHVLEMLKPGGWVQWEEFDAAKIMVLRGQPGVKSTAMDAIRQDAISLNADKITDAPLRLSSIFAKVGFKNTRREVYGSDRDPAYREKYTQVTMRALTSSINCFIQRRTPNVMNADALEKYIEEATEEIKDSKVYLQSSIYCSMGQKP